MIYGESRASRRRTRSARGGSAGRRRRDPTESPPHGHEDVHGRIPERRQEVVVPEKALEVRQAGPAPEGFGNRVVGEGEDQDDEDGDDTNDDEQRKDRREYPQQERELTLPERAERAAAATGGVGVPAPAAATAPERMSRSRESA